MSMTMKVRMLKSNESTIQPRKTAQNARHWAPVTWRNHGPSAADASTPGWTAAWVFTRWIVTRMGLFAGAGVAETVQQHRRQRVHLGDGRARRRQPFAEATRN